MSEHAPPGIQMKSTTGKVWDLVKPYWKSEEKGQAWLLLVAVVSLSLGMVYLLVQLNAWNNEFYNALQDKNFDAFVAALIKFSWIAFPFMAVSVYQTYLQQLLQIRWRRWLTDVFLTDWLAQRAYYRMDLISQGTDNPDQRIQEDLQTFTAMTLTLGLDFLRTLVTLVSFVFILWTLSGDLDFTLGGHQFTLPGYMMWIALLYAVIGTGITHKLGRPLIALNFTQQRLEADLRFSLVRLRENAEGVAFHGGEDGEKRTLLTRFSAVLGNVMNLMLCTKRLNWFTSMYDQLAAIFPVVLAAPRYFSGAIQLGGLMQTASAFGRVQDSLSWFISAYTSLASWKATVDRLTSFQEAIQAAAAEAAAGHGIALEPSAGSALVTDNVEVALPDGRVLLAHVDCTLLPGTNVLLTGPSGSGKSTLFRALAGIWPFGSGRVQVPSGATLLFLPQRPYLPLGSLRDVVAYPAVSGTYTDEAITAALTLCGLDALTAQLDDIEPWSHRLSPGEQQRLACARALLNKPDWLFLDEATSALDEALEQRIYELLREHLPGTTVVSIAHRSSVAKFHGRRLALMGDESNTLTLAES